MAPPPVEQQVTFIYAEDLTSTAGFYRDTIGLQEVLDQGGCRLFRVAGEAFLGVCSCREGREVAPGGVILTFVTPEVDGWYRHLRAAGVPTQAPPAEKPEFRIYNFFAEDPNGYLLEFQRFLNPCWPAPRD